MVVVAVMDDKRLKALAAFQIDEFVGHGMADENPFFPVGQAVLHMVVMPGMAEARLGRGGGGANSVKPRVANDRQAILRNMPKSPKLELETNA